MRSAVIAGLGSWVPPNVVTNDMLAGVLDTSDEWITSRTGIKQRHIVGDGMGTSDLAYEAGRRALQSADVKHVDFVVLATTTPDRLCPATAPEVASRLGQHDVPAFDVSAVCSGFVYGLQVAQSLICSGSAETVLLIAAESFSTLLDPHDRHTRPIFGDGAGAVLLRAGGPGEPGSVASIRLHSDGTLAHLITVPGGGARARGDAAYLTMQGRQTFVCAVERMSNVITETLTAVGWDVSDVDHLVGHQANVRILQALAKHAGFKPDAAIVNIHEVGNTAGASIPLALDYGVRTGRIRSGHQIMLAAFGAGATWGAAALQWNL
jgi:3-oxoacyl-[acyl-carrier-protein] synthase-3